MRFSAEDHMDFDGDGVADPSFLEGDPDQPIIIGSLHIQSGADPNQQWQIPLPSGIIASYVGFLDFDGGNPREILLAQKVGNRYINPIVINTGDGDDMEVQSFGANTVFVAARDFNGDGRADLLIADPDKKEVQVWGIR